MTTYLYMVRHAASPFVLGTDNERSRGLSAKGAADARRAGEILAAESIDAIVSSPYARAVETVQPLADRLGLPIRRIEELRERAIGSLNSELSEGEFLAAVRTSFDDPAYCLPEGESTGAAKDRAMPAIRRLLREYAGRKVAIGTHGNIMTIILQGFDSRYGFDFWSGTSKPDIYRLVFEGEELRGVERKWP